MYTQSITRSHRTAFILAIDQSGSMAEESPVPGTTDHQGRSRRRSHQPGCCSNSSNRARRSDEVRDYYDIAVLGYSGDGIVSLLNDPEPLVPVSRLAALPVDFAETVVERRMPDGEATFRKISMPAWIAPKAVGQTPMYERACRNPRPDTSVVHESGPQRKFSAPSSSTSPTGKPRTATSANSSRSAKRSAPSEPPTARCS